MAHGLRAIELADYLNICPPYTYHSEGKCFTHPVKQVRMLMHAVPEESGLNWELNLNSSYVMYHTGLSRFDLEFSSDSPKL